MVVGVGRTAMHERSDQAPANITIVLRLSLSSTAPHPSIGTGTPKLKVRDRAP